MRAQDTAFSTGAKAEEGGRYQAQVQQLMHSQSFSNVIFSHYISKYSQGDQTLLLVAPSGQHRTMEKNLLGNKKAI
jgi:hypothetical protein